MKIHGIDEDDLSFVEDHFDKVATKDPVANILTIDVDEDGETLFIKTGDGIFTGKDHGRGSKTGHALMTAETPLEKLDEEKVKKLRGKIEADLEKIGDRNDKGDKFDNPFLPRIDEID